MTTQQQGALAALLRDAGAAHGQYEERELNGVYDEQWPSWYAAYLVEHGINDLLGAQIDAAELSRLLADYHRQHQAHGAGQSWYDFYAERLTG